MAGFSDLKRMLDEARQRSPQTREPKPAAANPRSHRAAHREPPPTKGHGAAASPQAAAAARRAIAATKHADGDVDLARVFADVARLPAANKAGVARMRPPPIPRQTLADERDALEASKYGNDPAPHAWDIGQEIEAEQTHLRRGLGADVLTALRRGRWVVQAEIDLHGMTTDEARDALADFLLDARSRGLRCVRVVHGKGLTSPNREPVLKGKVRRWLAHWDDVLAYCEAPRHAGGSGAVVALLRGNRS
jgi:DNA-nicking Smr family endonuclease